MPLSFLNKINVKQGPLYFSNFRCTNATRNTLQQTNLRTEKKIRPAGANGKSEKSPYGGEKPHSPFYQANRVFQFQRISRCARAPLESESALTPWRCGKRESPEEIREAYRRRRILPSLSYRPENSCIHW